jgi:hypothetical protein
MYHLHAAKPEAKAFLLDVRFGDGSNAAHGARDEPLERLQAVKGNWQDKFSSRELAVTFRDAVQAEDYYVASSMFRAIAAEPKWLAAVRNLDIYSGIHTMMRHNGRHNGLAEFDALMPHPLRHAFRSLTIDLIMSPRHVVPNMKTLGRAMKRRFNGQSALPAANAA